MNEWICTYRIGGYWPPITDILRIIFFWNKFDIYQFKTVLKRSIFNHMIIKEFASGDRKIDQKCSMAEYDQPSPPCLHWTCLRVLLLDDWLINGWDIELFILGRTSSRWCFRGSPSGWIKISFFQNL